MSGRRLGAWLAVVGLVVLVPVSVAGRGAPPPPRGDLVAAVREAGTCGPFADDLPILVAESNLQPGDRTAEVEVCLRNDGAARGVVWLRVVDRHEEEVGCTEDEPALDDSCGEAGAGELGGALRVAVAARSGCTGPAVPSFTLQFAVLARNAVPVAELRKGELSCALLAIEYRPPSEEVAITAQTDRVTWRYAFDLVE